MLWAEGTVVRKAFMWKCAMTCLGIARRPEWVEAVSEKQRKGQRGCKEPDHGTLL